MTQHHALLSCGSNARGQLAIGSLDDSHIFQKCSFDGYPPFHLPTQTTRIVDLATGANHTLLLLERSDASGFIRREVWGCGDGRKGQLGLFRTGTSIFKKIELPLDEAGFGDHSFKLIGATWETSYIVLSCQGKDDVVISMGSNDYGDLGVGMQSEQRNRVFHVVDFEHLVDEAGSILTRGRAYVDSLTSGQRHVVLDLRVFCGGDTPKFEQILVGWGMSRHGQLGDSSSTTEMPPRISPKPQVISSVSRQIDPVIASPLALHHSIFLHASGRITPMGSNRKGQLQIVSNIERAADVKCTWNGTYCVIRDSEWYIVSSGSNTHCQLGSKEPCGRVLFPDTINTLDTRVQIVCGSEHVLALITALDGTSQVWGWGWNEHGNLGLGNTEDTPFPVRILPVDSNLQVCNVWAGCGTSWIYCTTST